MSQLIDNTVRLVDEFNDEIKNDLNSKRIDNSGMASSSIRIEKTDSSVTSFGVSYLYYLDQGRGAGKFPPAEEIRKWAASKPTEINPFLIGRKIAREGTEIFKNKSKGIMLESKRRKLLDEIKQQAPAWAKADGLQLIKSINGKIKN